MKEDLLIEMIEERLAIQTDVRNELRTEREKKPSAHSDYRVGWHAGAVGALEELLLQIRDAQ